MNGQDYTQLTLFPADSLASPFLSPGSAEARRTTVTSGRKCLELYKSSGPLGSLVRTLLASSAWRSTRCLLTWKVSATPARRSLYRLVPSTPRTGETGARLWATPTASQCGMTSCTSGRPQEKSTHLTTQVYLAETALLPTPKARDAKDTTRLPPSRLADPGKDSLVQRIGREIENADGGQLNPTWVEWLMGFPIGWTDLDA